MKITVQPSLMRGTVTAPPSKSEAHRALICAALCRGNSVIHGMNTICEDVEATAGCLNAWGATVTRHGDTVTVRGFDPIRQLPPPTLFCRESASTLRFLIPLCLLGGARVRLTGAPSLMRRPLSVYEAVCRQDGIVFEHTPESVGLCGRLKGGEYRVAGNISSQFISGLLFALPLLPRDSRILITPPVESRPYLDMTVAMLAQFGITVGMTDTVLTVPGGRTYRPCELTVEGDYSAAAVLEALNIGNGNAVTVNGLSADSRQGDRVCRTYFEQLRQGRPCLSVEQCPDLAPILMAVAAARQGAVLTGTHRLAFKESDRGVTMAAELEKFGAAVTVEDNRITVEPSALHAPTVPLYSHGDHRVAMALTVLLLQYGGSLEGAEAVSKSFPQYFDALKQLGARFTEE